ncbi:MAG TPA: hypothetical protein VMW27_25285 [Thermoanaerobaculia bacterium]|nr:hypothetical protein [Thermoanaerobaculia bacterium]
MRKKSEAIERDQYGIMVAAERCSDLIVAHELQQDGPIEIRLEHGKTEGWDDLSESRRTASQLEHHCWQIKRQSTDLEAQVMIGLFRSLYESVHISMAHLGLRDSVAVREVGDLRVLRDLSIRVKKPGVDLDYIEGDLNNIEKRWCSLIQGAIGASGIREALLLLKRFEVDFLGDERQIKKLSVSRLALLFSRPEAVWTAIHSLLSRSTDGAIAIDYEFLQDSALKEAEARNIPRDSTSIRQRLRRADDLTGEKDREEARQIYIEVEEEAKSGGDFEAATDAVLGLCSLAIGKDDLEVVAECLVRLDQYLGRIEVSYRNLVAMRFKAHFNVLQGFSKEAELLYGEVVRLATGNDERTRRQEFLARIGLAQLYCYLNRLDDARAEIARCDELLKAWLFGRKGELRRSLSEPKLYLAILLEDLASVQNILEAEEKAITSEQSATELGGLLLNYSNRARSLKKFACGLICARSASRLGDRSKNQEISLGADYSAAVLLAELERLEEGEGLAMAVRNRARVLGSQKIAGAANLLLASMKMSVEDYHPAIEYAREAVSMFSDEPAGYVMAKKSLAEALTAEGCLMEAIESLREALQVAEHHSAPIKEIISLLMRIAEASALAGEWDRVEIVLRRLESPEFEVPDMEKDWHILTERLNSYRELRSRFETVRLEEEPLEAAGTTDLATIQDANAEVYKSLLSWWDDWPNARSEVLDFWGRGNLARLMLNLRGFGDSPNLVAEAHSIEDIRQALRMLSMLSDVLIVLWKGDTGGGFNIVPLNGDYEDPGGWGYIVAAGSRVGPPASKPETNWYPVMGHAASILPEDLTAFMATEARSFLEQGRLLIVPATAIGSFGVGEKAIELLFSEVCRATTIARGSETERNLYEWVPYFSDVPLPVLADIVGEHSDSLRRLALLLVRRTREARASGPYGQIDKEIQMEFRAELDKLRELSRRLGNRFGWEQAREPFNATASQVTVEQVQKNASQNLEGRLLADMANTYRAEYRQEFVPLLVLQNLGYRWRVEDVAQVASSQRLSKTKSREVVGEWLMPPKPG